MTAMRKRQEVKEPGNRQEMRDPMDHIREVHRGNRNDKNSLQVRLQNLVTTFTNMELKIKVIGSPEQQRR
jgi:hypothetical protein